MPIQKILLATLLAALYGCQPETQVQQETAPAMQPASASVDAAVEQEANVAESAVAAPSVDTPVALPVKSEPVAKKAAAAALSETADKTVSEPAAKAVKEQAVAPVKEMAAVAATVVAAAAPEPVVSEADALALAKKNNCLACHAIDRKMVGPTWKAVAVKYRGDAGAEAHLVNKIAKGGSGVWGSMAMPGNSKISEADRTTLARFVLNLQ